MDGILIFDQPRSGAENMAIDDAMLNWCDIHQQVALRIYRWEKPTLSLGYFQPWEEWLAYRERVIAPQMPAVGIEQGTMSPHLQIVRRRTGGGAIVHHHDWTYALVVPWDQVRLGPTRNLYLWIHEGLVAWLTAGGFPAHMQPTSEPASKSAPFLCFKRRTEGDILVGNDKVIGSAQRRGKRSVLQHGSVLLGQSPYADVLPGLSELRERHPESSPKTPPQETLHEPYPFGRTILENTTRRFDVSWRDSNNTAVFGTEAMMESLALHQSTDWLERV